VKEEQEEQEVEESSGCKIMYVERLSRSWQLMILLLRRGLARGVERPRTRFEPSVGRYV
jgi:hypothetical protein